MKRAIQQSLRNDPAWRWFLPAFVVLQIPYLLPVLPSPLQDDYVHSYGSILMLTAVLQLLAGGIGHIEGRSERRFWRYWAAGYGFWWINSILNLALPANRGGLASELLVDFFYGCDYFLLVLAVFTAPHGPQPPTGIPRQVRILGAATLILGLVTYLIVIPLQVHPESYRTWIPSYSLYITMDLALSLALLRLTLSARSVQWRTVYGLLALTSLSLCACDLLEVLISLGRVDLGEGHLMEALWNLPLLVVVLAGRLSRPQYVTFPTAEEARPESRQPSPLLLSALIFPLLHILGYRGGLLGAPETIQSLREQWVLVCLLVLGALATLEHVDLRRATRESKRALGEARRLRLAKAVAEKSMVDKSLFLANVSHEIRTPMAGIVGLSRLVLKTDLPVQERHYAELLHRSARGLLTTMDDLLELSRWEAGRGTVQKEPFSIRELVREVRDDFQPRAETQGLMFVARVEPAVPEDCFGDRRHVRQVLRQLLSNALKFTPEGRIELHVSEVGALNGDGAEVSADASQLGHDGGGSLRFSVVDTGIGVAGECQERLFQPFSQEDGSSSRRFGGAGLGLAICRWLVEAMGGGLGIHSRRGEGSEFWFDVPLGPQPRLRWTDSPAGEAE